MRKLGNQEKKVPNPKNNTQETKEKRIPDFYDEHHENEGVNIKMIKRVVVRNQSSQY